MPTAPRRAQPVPRRTPSISVAFLSLLLIISAIPPVAAEAFYDNTFSEFTDTSGHSVDSRSVSTSYTTFSSLQATDITKLKDMYYITITAPYEIKNNEASPKPITAGSHPFTATVSGRTFHGNFHYEKTTDILGQVTSSRITYFFDDWDVNGLQGSLPISFSPFIALHGGGNGNIVMDGDSLLHVNQYNNYGWKTPTDYEIYHTSAILWENQLVVTDVPLDDYRIDIIRLISGEYNPSTIKIIDDGGNTTVESALLDDQTFWLRKSDANKIELSSPQTTYIIPLGISDIPDSNSVTVYIQNSQTGALLANAHLSILAAAGGTETEIINATLPGGTATYTLQPTGGGIPNPDYYRAVATVPGFTQVVENHSFTLTRNQHVIIDMRSDTGGPADPDRCYLEYYVRDLAANPIPSASVQCGNRIKTTNSAGYAIFEVDKNASHPWIAKKSGYVTIEGTATVADGPRYVVNVVLGPGTVPTNPPATPTLGPGETPGGPGATPTPDRRTNEEKGQAVIDMIADNAEGIGALALICLLMGLLKLMVKW